MAGQKTLSLLIVVLSLACNCTLGRPAEENSNDVTINEVESSKEEELQPKDQLLVFIFQNFKEISLLYVNEAQNISKDILKDETLLGHSSSVEIDGFKKNLTVFMDKYDKYQDIDDLFDLVDIFANATEFYMKLPSEAITTDTSVIIATLKKYGSDKLEIKFDQLFDEFVEKFKNLFEETKASLKEEKAMLDWFEELKTITKSPDKVIAFEKFLKFY